MSDQPANLITELFLRDPLELEDRDFEVIIEHFRKSRINFTTAHAKTKSATQTKKVVAAEAMGKTLGIDIDSIDV